MYKCSLQSSGLVVRVLDYQSKEASKIGSTFHLSEIGQGALGTLQL